MMKKLLICIAVVLSACSSQAADSPAPVMNNDEDMSVIPESEDFFTDSEQKEQPETDDTVPEIQSDDTAESSAEQQTEAGPEQQAETSPAVLGEVSPDDFAFYTSVVYNGIPEDAEYPSMKYAEGLWKYYLTDTSVSEDGTFFEEYGYADLSLDRVNNLVVISLDPKLDGDGFELYPVTDNPGYEPFSGGMTDDGALKLTGNGIELFLTYYYASQGRECISGVPWFTPTDQGVFLMTRMQDR